jgi:hypothetical protein
LEIIALIGQLIIEKKETFLGPSIWANFDGIHYLKIAQFGYAEFQQAFFPLYPLLIRLLANIFDTPQRYVISGLLISNISYVILLFVFTKLLTLVKIENKKISEINIRQSLIFLSFFPTSFYFGSVYTESLFLLFLLLSFLLVYLKKKFWYGFVASLASATRFVGVFLFVPVGLLGYMTYLGINYNDPLMFIHVQPYLGASRTTDELVFFPQVYYRYIKIFITVSISSYAWFIATVEFVFFNSTLFFLWKSWKEKLPIGWIFFSLISVIFPTLTGTLSSIPRYVLIAFPVFIVISFMNARFKTVYFTISYILFIVFTILFTQGYWIS